MAKVRKLAHTRLHMHGIWWWSGFQDHQHPLITKPVGSWHIRFVGVSHVPTIHSSLVQVFTPPHGQGTQTHHGSGKNQSFEKRHQNHLKQSSIFGFSVGFRSGLHPPPTSARLPFLPWHGPKNSDSGVAKIEATLLEMKNSSVLREWYSNRWTMVTLLYTWGGLINNGY